MIQRKQSIWLFLAALLNAGVFIFDLYRTHNVTHTMVNGTDTVVETMSQLRVSDNFVSLLIAIVITALPFVTIFLFNNRKRQIKLVLVSILAVIAFVAITLWRIPAFISAQVPPPTTSNYWIGAVLPVISVVFLIMAISGIRKDDKLVKSVDRLR